MAERLSKIFYRIMLVIFTAFIGLGVFLGTFGHLESLSYVIALILAAGILLMLKWLQPRILDRLEHLNHPGSVLTGLLLCIFCFVLNLIWVLSFQIEPTVDFKTFHDTARQIAGGERIDMLYIGLFPHILGYSTFLSVFIRLFGDSPLLAPLLNVALTTVSGLCLYILCHRWLGYRQAVFAFFFWSICPSKLLYNSMVMSEPTYTCFILLFLLLLSLACDGRGSYPVRCIAALPLGLACGALLLAINASRPIALILLIAFFLWLFLLRGKELKKLKSWGLLALFTAAMLLSYSRCDYYWNRWEYLHVFEQTSDVPAYNIYVGLNPESEGSYSEEDMDLLLNYRYNEEYGSAVYAQEQMLGEVKKRLSSGEINFPHLFAVKLAKLMGNDEGGAFYAQAELSRPQFVFWTAVGNIYYYILVILSILGAAVLFRKPVYSTVCIAPIYSIGLIMAHLIIEVSGRYKYSIIPLLVIVAAFSLPCGHTQSRKNLSVRQ